MASSLIRDPSFETMSATMRWHIGLPSGEISEWSERLTTDWIIDAGSAVDLPALRSLMMAAELPVDKLEPVLPDGLLVARAGDRLGGAGALQPAGEDGLLRSLVVDPDWRGRGLGVALLVALETLARDRAVRNLYLLTETAGAFFPRHGYVAADRAGVPPPVAATAEFHSVCPGSAVCLTKTLRSVG